MSRFARMIIWCVFWAALSVVLGVFAAHGQESTATAEEEAFPLIGRFTTDSALRLSPNARRIEVVEQGEEFLVVNDRRDDSSGQGWLEVCLLDRDDCGWVSFDSVELAQPYSTVDLRRYADGWCFAQPLPRRRSGVGYFDSYQNELSFDERVPLQDLFESGQLRLLFNNQQRDLDYRFHQKANALLLPNLWVGTHLGPLGPTWDQAEAWVLAFECVPEILAHVSG